MSFRICDDCGDLFDEGYCIEGGFRYYCSDACLEKHMTLEEFEDLYDDGEGDSYWTEWYSCGLEEMDLEEIHDAILKGKIDNVKCIVEGYDSSEQKIIYEYLQNKGVKIA